MMKTLKRWTTGIIASFDSVISQVENHEALVNAAIHEMQQAGSKARVQLKRVQQDGKRMRRKLVELEEAKEKWRERAVKTAKLDEKRALECLRREKRAVREIANLEEQEREHSKLEKQLSEDLDKIDERLRKLKQQRNMLRTRQSRAEALRASQVDDSTIISEIDDIFERWEIKVGDYELKGGCCTTTDSLESDFEEEEEIDELKAELAELVSDAG